MASHLRRTDDLERLKTRSIVLQNSDGTYPATNGAMYVSTDGTVAVSDNAVIDNSGNLFCKTATIGDVSDTATVLTVNGHALVHGNTTVTGLGPGRGTVGTDYVDIISHDPSHNPTFLYVLHNTLMWQDERHRLNNLLGWKSRMDPSGAAITALTGASSFGDVVDRINWLCELLSNKHSFLTFLPASSPAIQFNQPRSISFSSFLATNDTQRVNYTFTQPAGTTDAVTVLTNLNNQLEANGLALRFTYNSGTGLVTISPSLGFGFSVGNVGTYGSASLFLAHLGILGILVYNNYTGNVTGVTDISGGVTGMTVPSAPAAPSNATNITTSGFTVTIPTAVNPIKMINIYLNGISQGQATIVSGSYIFTGLRPSTNYTVQATFLTDYDESSLSPALSVTTAPIITNYSVNMLTQPGVTVTPYTGVPVNYTNVTVATVGAAAWPANLTQVSQIQSVEMQYYSGFSVWNPYYDSDARFVINPDANGNGTVLYYAYANRVNPASGDLAAVGSPNPVNQGPSQVAPDSMIFADQGILESFLGTPGDPNTIYKVDRSFAWFCGYPNSFIQNCQMTKFIINYTA